jgi:hypothetical protein
VRQIVALCMVSCIVSTGCSWLKPDASKQYLAENERLIRDYRQQRDIAARLEIENRALIARIGDLENRMAAISDAIDHSTAPPIRESGEKGGVFLPASRGNRGESAPAPPPGGSSSNGDGVPISSLPPTSFANPWQTNR